MSEQSPWGTPPPPSYGHPTGPPPSGPPPVGPPPSAPPGYGGYPGYPGGPGGPGGPGAPGPRRRTGLVVGVVAAVLVVVAGAALAVVLVAGKGHDSATDKDSTSPSTSAPAPAVSTPSVTVTTVTAPPAPPPTSSAPKLPPPDADTVKGRGYRFELPDGWQRARKSVLTTLQSSAGGSGLDRAILYGGPSIQLATANIITETTTTGGLDRLHLVAPVWREQLRSVANKPLTKLHEITIDGEPAAGAHVAYTNSNGVPIEQTFYLTLHDGSSYQIGLSQEASVSDHDADLKDVLATWRWTR